MSKRGRIVDISTLGDLTALLNHNCHVLEKRLGKLNTRCNLLMIGLTAAAMGLAVLERERRKQEEEIYQLSIRVKKLEYGEGE